MPDNAATSLWALNLRNFTNLFLVIFVFKFKGSVQQILGTLTQTLGPVLEAEPWHH